MENNNLIVNGSKKAVIVIVAIVFILVILGVLIFREHKQVVNDNNGNSTLSKNTDIVQELKKDPKINKLINDQANSNSYETFNGLEQAANNEKNSAKKESLKLYAASSLVKLDLTKGAEYFASIAADPTVDDFTKAYAMTRLTQYGTGYANMNLNKMVFSDTNILKGLTPNQINLEINKKIVETYPLALPVARYARYKLIESPSTTTAREMYDKYMPGIINDLSVYVSQDGLRHFIPDVNLNVAVFLKEAEKYGVSNDAEVRKYFDQAYKEALSQNLVNTMQFTLLGYTDYLLGKSDATSTVDAEKLIVKLLDTQFSPMLNSYLSAGLNNQPNITKYIKSSEKYSKDLKTKLTIEKK